MVTIFSRPSVEKLQISSNVDNDYTKDINVTFYVGSCFHNAGVTLLMQVG